MPGLAGIGRAESRGAGSGCGVAGVKRDAPRAGARVLEERPPPDKPWEHRPAAQSCRPQQEGRREGDPGTPVMARPEGPSRDEQVIGEHRGAEGFSWIRVTCQQDPTGLPAPARRSRDFRANQTQAEPEGPEQTARALLVATQRRKANTRFIPVRWTRGSRPAAFCGSPAAEPEDEALQGREQD